MYGGYDSLVSYEGITIPYQSDNPTDEQRHAMLKFLLTIDRRPEDFENLKELLGPPPDIKTICPKGYGKRIRVAVIGAGESGLAAAFELRKIGCSITIFEAGERIGGRIYTHYFDESKRYFAELGAMENRC